MEIEVSVRERGDVRIVDARGRATIGESSDRLHSELRYLIEHGWRKILVNLSDLKAIDSTGISVLVRNCTHLVRAGGSLKLVCPGGRVRDALSITRLIEVITTFDNEAAGLASFQ